MEGNRMRDENRKGFEDRRRNRKKVDGGQKGGNMRENRRWYCVDKK